MRYFFLFMLFVIKASAGYLNLPIDDQRNLLISCQIAQKLFSDTGQPKHTIDNSWGDQYSSLEISTNGSRIDFKNYSKALASLLPKGKSEEINYSSAFKNDLLNFVKESENEWLIEVQGYYSRRKVGFSITNLTNLPSPLGISIVIPTFNRITECTACILMFKARILAPKNQWEVIVVADGCTDGTGMHFENLFKQKGFDNFRVIWTDKEPGKYRNAGWPENSGVRAAKYSHVSLCDCDIYHLCDPITPSLRHLATDQETMIGGKLYCISSPKAMHDAYAPEMILEKYKWQEFCEAGWLVIKREHYLRIGGSSEKLMNWGCEDTDLITRLKKLGLGIRYVDEIIYVLGNEFRSDHKQNPKELGKLNLSVLKADGELVRNQDKPDWGKYFTQPVYPEQEPDFSKVN